MSNEEVAPVGRPRQPRQGVSGSPVGSTLSIVLAVVAVIAGFLILRNITAGDDSTAEPSPPGDTSAVPGDSVPVGDTTTTTTTTTTVPPTRIGATVIVANASGIGGSAGRMSKTLQTAGYDVGEPTNAAGGTRLDDSVVYYDPTVASAEAVAQSLGIDLGGVEVSALPTPIPTEDASLGGAGVLVMLGVNQADKTLEELAAPATTETGQAPAPAGSDATVTTDPAG